MSKQKKDDNNTVKGNCEVCGVKIEVMSFRGTGVCSENHRKIRDKETQPIRSQMDAGITQMNLGATSGGIKPGGIR